MPYPNARSWNLIAAQLLICLLLSVAPASHAQSNRDKAARFYEDALQRYERKDVASAIIQLKNALQIDKTMLQVQLLLGKALLESSDPIGAEVAFNEALRLGVSRNEIAVPLAQALAAQGKLNQIVESPLLDPAGLPPTVQQQLLLIRAEAHSDLGAPAKAMRAVEDARALAPRLPDVWLAEVPLRLRSREFAAANAAIERASQLGPATAELHLHRASVLHLQGRLDEASDSYAKALTLQPKLTEAAVSRIGVLLDLGRDKEASTALAVLLAQQPSEPRALYLKALLAERGGDRSTSKAALASITSLMDPVPLDFIRYRPQLLLLTALAHFGLGSHAKAKPYLEAAWRVQGPSPIAKLLARVYLDENAPDKAVEILESYLRHTPGDGNALTLLASIHTAQGRHAKATALMREALSARDSADFQTALGLSLLRGGQMGGAVDSLERAFKKDPKQVYAGSALINVYLRDGRVAKALAVAETMRKQHPNNPSVLVLYASAAGRNADAQAARQALEKALQLSPGLVQAELGLARLETAGRDYASASRRLLALHKADERSVDVLIELISLAEAEGKAADVQRWLAKAEDVASPRDVRPQLASVHANLRLKQPAQALEASKRLIAKAPEDAEALALHAEVQLLTGDMNGARSTLSGASRRAAANVPSLIKIAELQMRARDLNAAQYSLEKVLSVEPVSIRGQSLMAGIELQRGELAQAERRARALIQANPKSAQGHHLLADIALARKQPAAAIEPLRRAHQLEPTSLSLLRLFSIQSAVEGQKAGVQIAETWLKQRPADTLVLKALGDSHARQGALQAAAGAYDRALKVNANDAEALNSLATVRLLQGSTQSITLAQRAVALEPANALYIDTLGTAEFRLGNAERALPLLRDARLRLPGNAEIRLHLAEALVKLGRITEAKAELEAAVSNQADRDSAAKAAALLATLK